MKTKTQSATETKDGKYKEDLNSLLVTTERGASTAGVGGAEVRIWSDVKKQDLAVKKEGGGWGGGDNICFMGWGSIRRTDYKKMELRREKEWAECKESNHRWV